MSYTQGGGVSVNQICDQWAPHGSASGELAGDRAPTRSSQSTVQGTIRYEVKPYGFLGMRRVELWRRGTWRAPESTSATSAAMDSTVTLATTGAPSAGLSVG